MFNPEMYSHLSSSLIGTTQNSLSLQKEAVFLLLLFRLSLIFADSFFVRLLMLKPRNRLSAQIERRQAI